MLHMSGLLYATYCVFFARIVNILKSFIYVIYSKFETTDVIIGWRERNQQAATNLMFIIKLLSQHVSDIIMPIIRRTRVCTAAYGVLNW